MRNPIKKPEFGIPSVWNQQNSGFFFHDLQASELISDGLKWVLIIGVYKSITIYKICLITAPKALI